MVAAEGVAISAIMAVERAAMQAPVRRLLHQLKDGKCIISQAQQPVAKVRHALLLFLYEVRE